MPHWDAIVIGTGGVGSAALFHLAAKGLRVLGVDRYAPPHDHGSSHGQTRIIRQAYFEHPDYVPLTLASYQLWSDLEAAAGIQLYRQTGVVEIGPPNGEVVPGVLRAALEHHLDVTELTAAQIRHRWPGLVVPDHLVGVYEHMAGYLMPEACIASHLGAARSVGATVLDDSPLDAWHAEDDRVAIEIRSSRHTTDRLLITAGAWAGGMLADLGIRLTVLRKPLLWYAVKDHSIYAADRGFPAHLIELPYGVMYGFPQIDERGVKLAEHSGGTEVNDPLQLDRSIRLSDTEPIERFIHDHLPQVSTTLVDSTVCMYTMSPDSHFILDRHPIYERVWLCAGLSGHGFKFTCALGQALADLSAEGGTSLPVGFLGLDRFA